MDFFGLLAKKQFLSQKYKNLYERKSIYGSHKNPLTQINLNTLLDFLLPHPLLAYTILMRFK